MLVYYQDKLRPEKEIIVLAPIHIGIHVKTWRSLCAHARMMMTLVLSDGIQKNFIHVKIFDFAFAFNLRYCTKTNVWVHIM